MLINQDPLTYNIYIISLGKFLIKSAVSYTQMNQKLFIG